MPLSSDDIVNWELKTGVRGYVVAQVDELLDEVADELDRLGARVVELEQERALARRSLENQLEVEETLHGTLVQAKEAADQALLDARAAAAATIREAEQRAAEIVEQARLDAEREAEEVRAKLRATEARMRGDGANLRRELARLHALEAETRALLQGVYRDRLDALEGPEPLLPPVVVDDDLLEDERGLPGDRVL